MSSGDDEHLPSQLERAVPAACESDNHNPDRCGTVEPARDALQVLRESSAIAPVRIRPVGGIARGWSWFTRGCARALNWLRPKRNDASEVGAEFTDGAIYAAKGWLAGFHLRARELETTIASKAAEARKAEALADLEIRSLGHLERKRAAEADLAEEEVKKRRQDRIIAALDRLRELEATIASKAAEARKTEALADLEIRSLEHLERKRTAEADLAEEEVKKRRQDRIIAALDRLEGAGIHVYPTFHDNQLVVTRRPPSPLSKSGPPRASEGGDPLSHDDRASLAPPRMPTVGKGKGNDESGAA